jgi:small subunit ribosomal protein S16
MTMLQAHRGHDHVDDAGGAGKPGPHQRQPAAAHRAGAGVEVRDVNQLLKQFREMKKMMKTMSKLMGKGRSPDLQALMAGASVVAFLYMLPRARWPAECTRVTQYTRPRKARGSQTSPAPSWGARNSLSGESSPPTRAARAMAGSSKTIGRYFPLEEPARIEIQEDRAMHWLERGAQPTETVRNLFSKQGIMLALHLKRKGKSEEEISAAVESIGRIVRRKKARSVKLTPAARRAAGARGRAQARSQRRKRIVGSAQRPKPRLARRPSARRKKPPRRVPRPPKPRVRSRKRRIRQPLPPKQRALPVEDNTVPQDTPDVPAGEEAPAKEAGEESVTEEAVEQESEEKKASDRSSLLFFESND